jgi:hypothetical protein
MPIDEPQECNPDTGTPQDDPQVDEMTIQTAPTVEAQVPPVLIPVQPPPITPPGYNFATGQSQ